MANLLFEILTEEIPYSLQKKAEEDIKFLWQEAFHKAGINFQNIEIYSTPRRLVTHIDGLDERIDDSFEEKKGPSASAKKEAIDGFLRSNNVSLHDLELRKTDKGDFYFLKITKEGGKIEDIIPQIIQLEILGKMKFQKSMKYNETKITWARPIRNFLGILEVVDNTTHIDMNFAGVHSSKHTYTHRFLGENPVSVLSIADYFQKLKDNFVILSALDRKNLILKEVNKIAVKHDCVMYENDNLINEIAYLVEYVCVLEGEIPAKYMILPDELLVNIIAKNQRYINLVNRDGSLSNKFIIVSNIKAIDGGSEIILGNKKVLDARLEDGLFFYNNDLKTPLLDRLENLEKINFFEGLGSLYIKKERVKKLFKDIFKEDQDLLCDLYKVDLTTSVVFEIPDLQGIMGKYYALKQGYPVEVAEAIAEQYKPQGANDSIPSSILGAKLALLDKLDTLISLFSIGRKPTGSKDPFALRRSALGIIRIILEFKLDINLSDFLKEDVIEFLKERLVFYAKDKSFDISLINNIVAKDSSCNVLKMYEDMIFLTDLFSKESGAKSIQLFKRVKNICQSSSVNISENVKILEVLLQETTEKDLYKQLLVVESNVVNSLKRNSMEDSLHQVVSLKPFVDSFLDEIVINKSLNEDVKNNRLLLMYKVLYLLNSIFPFEGLDS